MVVAASCGSDSSYGGLMLVVAQDGSLDIDGLEIRVVSNGRVLLQNKYRVPEEARLPTTLAVVSSDDSRDTFELAVVGWQGGVPLDRRDAIVSQVPRDRLATLRVVLSSRCSHLVVANMADDGVASALTTCAEGDTCDPVRGACVSATVSGTSLPDYRSGEENEQPGAGGAAASLMDGGAGGAAGVDTTSMGGERGGAAGAESDLPIAGASGALTSGGAGSQAGGAPSIGCVPSCSEETPVCLEQTCVACVPNAEPEHCSPEDVPQFCDATGTWADAPGGACKVNEVCEAGACECSGTVCDDGCVNTTDDTANCGSCGHACAVGACVDGACSPVGLVTDAITPQGVAVGGGNLYWVADKKVMLMSLTERQAGELPIIGMGEDLCASGIQGAIIANATFVYWSGLFVCQKRHSISTSVDRAGKNAMYAEGGQLNWLAGTGDNVFAVELYDRYIHSSDGSIFNYWANGGGGSVAALATDAQNLYWLQGNGAGATFVYKHAAPALTAYPIELAKNQDAGEGMAAYNGFVYWTASTSETDATGRVHRVSTNGGVVSTVASAQLNPSGLAVDASGVYWTNRHASGSVMHAPHQGGEAVALASNQNGAHGIALDSTTVYWTNTEGGQVMMVSK